MGDHAPGNIQVGGAPNKRRLASLIQAFQKDGLGYDYGEFDTRFCMEGLQSQMDSHDDALMLFDDMMSMSGPWHTMKKCRQFKLPFIVRIDGKYEHSQGVWYWEQGMKEEKFESTINEHDQVVELCRVLDVLDRHKDPHKALRALRKVLPKPFPNVPDFELPV